MALQTFLLVDDEPLVLAALRGFFQRHGETHAAPSIAAARRALAEPSRTWGGFVVDVNLADGNGLELLAEARAIAPEAPALALSGVMDRDAINRAASIGARFMCKPCGPAELGWVVEKPSPVERARERWGLSPRETEILASALRRQPREAFLAETGMSRNTYKTHVRKALEKADYENLASLVIDLLAER